MHVIVSPYLPYLFTFCIKKDKGFVDWLKINARQLLLAFSISVSSEVDYQIVS